MEKIRKILEARRQNLLHIKNQKEKALSNVPDGNLRICNNKGRIQYYHRTNPKDFNGVYLREQDKELVRQLAQKDYDKKVLTEVEKELIATERYLKATKSLELKQIYETLHQERQKLITPIWLPDDEYIKVWEHLGMMDDPNYVDMAIKKINTYEQNDILLGKNLILTYETKKNPLNSKTIKLIIQHYL